jgi:4-amino-4-deoxy-L-arabinose transferase-like glycosyltransferase
MASIDTPAPAGQEALSRRCQVAIVACALALFVGVAGLAAVHHPYPFFDDPDFLDLANRIRASGGPGQLVADLFAGRFVEANRHPLYLAILALFARPEFGFHRDAQALGVALGAVAFLSCCWATRRHLGGTAAAVLAVLFAGSGVLVWVSRRECADALLLALWAPAVSAILDGGGGDDARARRAFLAAGALAGLAYLAKGPGLFLPVCLGLTLLLREGLTALRQGRTWLFAGAFALVASPLWWRNLRVFGSPFYHDNGRLLWIDRLPDYAEVYAPYADARLPHGLREYLSRATPGGVAWRVGMGIGETTFHLGDAMALVAPHPSGVLHVAWVVAGVIGAVAALRLVWRSEPGFRRTFLLVHSGWWIAFLAFFNAAGGAARYFLPLAATTLLPALAARVAADLRRAGSLRRSRWACFAGAAVVLAVVSTVVLDRSPTRPPPGYLEVQGWLAKRLDPGDVYAVDARTHLRPSWVIPQAQQLIVSASWQDRPVPRDQMIGYLCEKRARYVVLDAAAVTTSVEAGATRARYLFYDVLPLDRDGSLPLAGFPAGWRPVYVGAESPRRWVVLETACPGGAGLSGPSGR